MRLSSSLPGEILHCAAFVLGLVCHAAGVVELSAAEEAPVARTAPEFQRDVLPIFRQYCAGCHQSRESESGVVLEDYASTMRGGTDGVVVVAGQLEQSRLWQVVLGPDPTMPPADSPQLTAAQKQLISDWIVAGALPPTSSEPPILRTPHFEPRGPVRAPITALSADPQGRFVAVARSREVELLAPGSLDVIQKLGGHTGAIADVSCSADGRLLIVAAGESGLHGEATVWETTNWSRQQVLSGHADSLYAARLSRDGTQALTASYDRQLIAWDAATGRALQPFIGHNDAVYSAAFHPTRPMVFSASGDRTIKLWNLASGARLDTLGQPTKEQYSLSLSPNGQLLAAGGADMRIRVWKISEDGQEGTNPMLFARFAHEGPVQKVVFSPDGRLLVSASEDRRIKFWETRTFTEVALLERQPDWTPALAFSPDGLTLYVGRLNGELATYSVNPNWADQPSDIAPLREEVLAMPASAPAAAPLMETEPNESTSELALQTVPFVIQGKLHTATAPNHADTDQFRITAQAGQTLVIETKAQRNGSPADTRLDVLHADGRPVLRARLQAVRDSWITFRPIDSSGAEIRLEYWAEMDLNQYLYMSGEVCRLERAPRGPDSGFNMFTHEGKRRGYFDTSATGHAKEEPVYIVQPYAPTATLIDNGLPVFPLYYQNDDDADRELGSDSRLLFTPPDTGDYRIQVTDVRGFSGDNFAYELTVRPAQPDFSVRLAATDLTIPAGSGQRVKFIADRMDGFDGDIAIVVDQLPEGLTVASPIVIPAGHLEATTVMRAAASATTPTDPQKQQLRLRASGLVMRAGTTSVAVNSPAVVNFGAQTIEHDVAPWGVLAVGAAPSIEVFLEPDQPQWTGPAGELLAPAGETITARIRIVRKSFEGNVQLDVEGLPHGMIVDNIGLNGVLVRAGETERQIQLTSRPWLAAGQFQISAVSQGEGAQASAPLLLQVVPRAELTAR